MCSLSGRKLTRTTGRSIRLPVSAKPCPALSSSMTPRQPHRTRQAATVSRMVLSVTYIKMKRSSAAPTRTVIPTSGALLISAVITKPTMLPTDPNTIAPSTVANVVIPTMDALVEALVLAKTNVQNTSVQFTGMFQNQSAAMPNYTLRRCDGAACSRQSLGAPTYVREPPCPLR
jgi:hypothetical protein